MTHRELPLFVYGTLMKDGGQAHMLAARRHQKGWTRGALYSLPAGYPALVLGEDGVVHGEWVDDPGERRLQLLDTYEGVAEGLYQRVVIEVTTVSATFEAWAYVMSDARAHGGRRIQSGRWRAVRRR